MFAGSKVMLRRWWLLLAGCSRQRSGENSRGCADLYEDSFPGGVIAKSRRKSEEWFEMKVALL